MTSIFSHKVSKKILLMDFFFACLLKNLSQDLLKSIVVFLATCLFSNFIYVFSRHILYFLVLCKKRKISIHNGWEINDKQSNIFNFFYLRTTRFFIKRELTTICIIVRFKMMIKNAAKNVFILDHGLRLSCHSDTF